MSRDNGPIEIEMADKDDDHLLSKSRKSDIEGVRRVSETRILEYVLGFIMYGPV